MEVRCLSKGGAVLTWAFALDWMRTGNLTMTDVIEVVSILD